MVEQQKSTSRYLSIMNNMLFFARGTKVVQQEEVESFVLANKKLDEVNTYISEMKKEGEDFYKERYRIGLQDGQEEGSFDHLLKVVGTVFSSIKFIETIDETLIKIITEAVYKVVGNVGTIAHIHEWVESGLVEIKNKNRIILRISPEDEQKFLEKMDILQEKNSKILFFISIIPDESINPGKCMLESEVGVVLSTLEMQVKALEQVLESC